MPTKPQAPGVTGFDYVRKSRPFENPAFARIPTTQQEWNGFIVELNKWIRHEAHAFVPTFGANQFAVEPADPVIAYEIYGQFVVLNFEDVGTGTSGGASGNLFTITNLPSVLTPKWNQVYYITGMRDNSAATTGTIKISTDSTIVFTKGTNGAGGGWTASGAKGFDDRGNCVIYTLSKLAQGSQVGPL